ncbi:hypothetical protein BV898_12622 [Hypsibius exemplaris]|uniref:G-protein coupled receptors family 1 profile domain-containing protein n=1 Tax=Hypsibius exemplaris TaxID=2072580 RepID=A0A1W0WCZ6_HYPEX|nr:hypothetical protein BV898_12622 [Hypsibius exemplaris]
MLFFSFVFCVLCNFPTSVMTSISFTGGFNSFLPMLRIWMHVCLLSQYTFTPLILFACNRDYRDGFRKLMGRNRTRDVNAVAPRGNGGLSNMATSNPICESAFG